MSGEPAKPLRGIYLATHFHNYYQVAPIEDRLDPEPELGPVRDRCPQDVAGRDVGNAVRRRDPLRLRALAGSLDARLPLGAPIVKTQFMKRSSKAPPFRMPK